MRLPYFFIKCDNAAAEHAYFNIFKMYHKTSLLVLDESLLLPAADAQQRRILLELLERRFGNVSTIFCSQYNEKGWHDQFGS